MFDEGAWFTYDEHETARLKSLGLKYETYDPADRVDYTITYLVDTLSGCSRVDGTRTLLIREMKLPSGCLQQNLPGRRVRLHPHRTTQCWQEGASILLGTVIRCPSPAINGPPVLAWANTCGHWYNLLVDASISLGFTFLRKLSCDVKGCEIVVT